MFTVFGLNHFNLYSYKQATLECKEWGFDFVCSDRYDGANIVRADVRLRLK